MSSPIIIPPPLVRGEPYDRQRSAELQQFYQRHILPEVLRFDFDSVAGIGWFGVLRIPTRKGMASYIRTYAFNPGSGAYTFDVLYTDSSSVAHSVFAVVGDRITSNTGNASLVEAPCTATNLIVDPYDTTAGRFWCNCTAFSGTAWVGVVVEVVLIPTSQ